MRGSAANGARVRIAYLCNVYPAVSHSFVRREIEAVERACHEVVRFSVRPIHRDITEEADLREATATTVVLEQGWAALSLSALSIALANPRSAYKALRIAYRLAGNG